MVQLPLDLALPPRLGVEDFLVTAGNEAAFAAVARWPDWPGNLLCIVGPEGAGKSHLGAIWADRAVATRVNGRDLSSRSPELFASRPVLLDDADGVTGNEPALFHALNLLREAGQPALLLARSAPDSWNLRTADLLSRLRLAPLVRVERPDDALVEAVLVKLLADRQLVVETSVLGFLSRRMERSVAAARRLVAALDHTGLAEGRRITRSVAAGVLAALEAAESSSHGDVTGVGHNPPDP